MGAQIIVDHQTASDGEYTAMRDRMVAQLVQGARFSAGLLGDLARAVHEPADEMLQQLAVTTFEDDDAT